MSSSRPVIEPHVSRNFQTAKVLAILAVFTSHFFPQSRLWVVAAIALFVFGFSSAYFTARKYPSVPRGSGFFRQKLIRLGPNLLVINVILLALFLVEDRSNIFSGHTLINLIGMNGLLNWLRIPNLSPFGAGQWFLTLLLIFYFIYPALARWQPGRGMAIVTSLGLLAAATALTQWADPGHMVWLTAFAFLVGVIYVKAGWQPDWRWLAGALACVLVTAGVLKFGFGVGAASTALIVVLSVALLALLLRLTLPDVLHRLAAPLAGCVLEIYLLHVYFIVHPTGQPMADWLLSMALVCLIAMAVSRAADWVAQRLGVAG